MTDRDDLLRRVRKANPVLSGQDLPAEIADSRPPLAFLIDGEDAMEQPTKTTTGWRRRRGPLIAAAALAVTVAVGLPILLLNTDGTTTPPAADTTTTAVPTTVAPTTTAPPATGAPATTATTEPPPNTTAPPEPVVTPAMEWERVPGQPGFESGHMGAVVAGGPGVVAVGGVTTVIERTTSTGSTYYANRQDAAVWVSADGRQWELIDDPDLFGDAGHIVDVAQGPAGLVGIGTTSSRDGVAWLSTDGHAWERIDDASFGGPGSQEMVAIAAGSGGLVAVGNGEREALVWVSEDGTSWTPIEDEALQVRAYVHDVLASDHGYVVIGEEFLSDYVNVPAMWVSPDGLTWDRIPAALFTSEDPTAAITALVGLTASPDGTLLVWDSRGNLWLSSDGYDWWLPETLEPPSGITWKAVWDGDRIVGIGSTQGFFVPNAAILVSPDRGLTWTVTFTEENAEVYSITRFGAEFIAVGVEGSGTGDGDLGDAAVWIGTWAD